MPLRPLDLPMLLLSSALLASCSPEPPAAAGPEVPVHWLGSFQVRAEPGETVVTEEVSDFTLRHVIRHGRTLFSTYEGPAPSVDQYRRERFRRACGRTWYRLLAREGGRERIVGYFVGGTPIASHLFGAAVIADAASARLFERRLVLPRC